MIEYIYIIIKSVEEQSPWPQNEGSGSARVSCFKCE